MTKKMMALAILTLAGTAIAQPASFTDLGNHSGSANTFTQDVTLLAPNDIQWFRIVLPAVNTAAGYVDIWTAAVGDITDTEIALYDESGNGAGSATTYYDDDSGPGLFSQLTFGSTTERPNLGGAAAARNGSDGVLAGGVYYLGVGRYNVTWDVGFSATSNYAGAQTTTQVTFDIQPATAPYPPTGTGTATPASVEPGSPVVYAVTVLPGGNPASTGITVTGDLSSVGGSAAAAFHDDGANGDASAGDGIYSFQYVIPAGTAGGNYSVSVTIADAQSRSSSTTISSNVFNPLDLGTLTDNVTVSQNADLAAGEVKWYRATIADCTTAAQRQLNITTEHSGAGDSELGAYSADGTLLVSADDIVGAFAKLTFGYQGANGDAPAGTYYIALGAFNTTFTTPFGATSTGPAASFLLEVTQTTDFPPDAGDTIETAMVPSGTGELSSIDGLFDFGADVDMYKINICDPANFSASTVGGSTADTQLFLFTESGMGVTSDDDTATGQSTITNQFVSTAGTYYIAVNRYNIDPVDASEQLLWANQPFNVERAPDGPGAANAFDHWTGAATGSGSYTLTFTGTCFPGGGTTQCSPADVGAAGGVAGHDRLLNNNDFIAFITLFFAQDAQADLGVAGGAPGHDGAWNNNDFIAFINYFFNDAAACNG